MNSHRKKMLAHVLACLPEEACGLVASDGQISKDVYPIRNELHSTTRFRMDPLEQFDAFMDMENQQLMLAGIFHSHPKGPGQLSERDIVEFAYPGVSMLLWYPVGNQWHCDCFKISGKDVEKLDLLCYDKL
jgi:proteasome lid subunit RPN8/RPN11